MNVPFIFGLLARFRSVRAANRVICMDQDFVGPIFQRQRPLFDAPSG